MKGPRAAEQLFVGVRTVHIGGVEEVDAEIEGAMDDGDVLRVVGRPVEVGHAHAAEADGRDGGAAGTEGARVHSGESTPGAGVRVRRAPGR